MKIKTTLLLIVIISTLFFVNSCDRATEQDRTALPADLVDPLNCSAGTHFVKKTFVYNDIEMFPIKHAADTSKLYVVYRDDLRLDVVEAYAFPLSQFLTKSNGTNVTIGACFADTIIPKHYFTNLKIDSISSIKYDTTYNNYEIVTTTNGVLVTLNLARDRITSIDTLYNGTLILGTVDFDNNSILDIK